MTDPLISVLVPCAAGETDALAHTVGYLCHQSYRGFQLCVAGCEQVLAVATAAAASLPLPLRGVLVEPTGTIAHRLSRALTGSDGSWLVILDPGDELGEDALFRVVEALHHDPDVDVVYSDEDEQDNDGSGPFRKPAWSPEYLEGLDYFGRLTAYRRSVVEAVGGVRPEFDGAHEWDLALRVTEVTDRVMHIQRPLCRRRRTLRSHWQLERIRAASRRAVLDRYTRRGGYGLVAELNVPGCLLARPTLTRSPSVSVIIPTAGARRQPRGPDRMLVEGCLDGLTERTSYQNFEVTLVIGDVEPPGLLRYAQDRLGARRARLLRVPGAFDFSRSCNIAALHATGDYLLLLNDDTDPIEPQWLEMMLERAQDPQVGAVGAKLFFADGTVQHAGVFRNGEGVPNHVHFHEVDGGGYHGSLQVTLNHTAVSGACLLIRRTTYLAFGGLTPRLPMSFGDVDLCLKLGFGGLRNVLVNAATLVHFESSSRDPTVTDWEHSRLTLRWPWASAPERYVSSLRLSAH